MAFWDYFIDSINNNTEINLDLHNDCEGSNNSSNIKICCLDSVLYSNCSKNDSQKYNNFNKKYFYFYLSFSESLIYDFNFIWNNSPPNIKNLNKENIKNYIKLTWIIKSNT